MDDCSSNAVDNAVQFFGQRASVGGGSTGLDDVECSGVVESCSDVVQFKQVNRRRLGAHPYKNGQNIRLSGERDDALMDTVLEPVTSTDTTVQREVNTTTATGGAAAAGFEKLSADRQLRMEFVGGGGMNTTGTGMRSGVSTSFEIRRVVVPQNRITQLQRCWEQIYTPLVSHMNLQVRMNLKRKTIEMRLDPTAGKVELACLEKGADFVRAFLLGFDVVDALALLRLDDLFVESFQVKDVKKLTGDHLARCIGRLSGKDGKTKYAIENSTRTRIVIANTHIHILGSFQNIKVARHSICSLILGSPPGKVYNHLRSVSRRIRERL
eukprot:Lankesteria_metandrocarpae@DN2828_c1_g1_i2.p1